MQGKYIAISASLLLGLIALGTQRTLSQTLATRGIDTAQQAMVVLGQPFSARKFRLTLRTLTDGKQVILDKREGIEEARDSNGRVRIKSAVNCDQTSSSNVPHCSEWYVIVFDPVAKTMTHWFEGEGASNEAIVIQLSPAQNEDARAATILKDEDISESDPEATNEITKNLGEEKIEGVLAEGTRRTTNTPGGVSANGKSMTSVHEVWKSDEMQIVVKIVDGDPQGKEIIRGLEQISMAPDPALFIPPTGYSVLKYSSNWRKFADQDVLDMADWQVK